MWFRRPLQRFLQFFSNFVFCDFFKNFLSRFGFGLGGTVEGGGRRVGVKYLRYAALVVTGEVPWVGAGLHWRLLAGVAGTRPPVSLQLLTVRAATPGIRISLNNVNYSILFTSSAQSCFFGQETDHGAKAVVVSIFINRAAETGKSLEHN